MIDRRMRRELERRDPRPKLIAVIDEISELMPEAASLFANETHPAHAVASRLVLRADGLLRATAAWIEQLKADGKPAAAEDLEIVLERARKIRDEIMKLIEEYR